LADLSGDVILCHDWPSNETKANPATNASDAAKRAMLRQGMPWIEREILGQPITLRCGEDLLLDRDCCHLMKGGLGFRPFGLGILGAHYVRGARLDQKVEFGVTFVQLVDHRLTKKVRIGGVGDYGRGLLISALIQLAFFRYRPSR
jgi:hypothetical protein